MKKQTKGFFISFEGGEATGKTTQIKKIRNWFKKNKVPHTLTREPGGTKLSENLRKIILSSKYKINTKIEVFLLMVSRIDHINRIISPALKNKKVIISDRYVDSTAIYQGYYNKFGIKNVYDLHKQYLNNILPNLTFYFDVDTATTSARLRKRKIKNKYDIIEKKFNNKIRKGYLKIAKNNKRFIIINASLNKEEIHKIIINKLLKEFSKNGFRVSKKGN